ncbi:hypothetical protein QBC35DRAFT_450468 [Podospora australis]|uniref:Uncharacterized protein n=1 Tax=Podospora australis TaxID=1536484 RepID=A0AAN6WWL9_9PEZI|nr:hypothetical protein QBC35DRAFT_450468 [Podospora australis]
MARSEVVVTQNVAPGQERVEIAGLPAVVDVGESLRSNLERRLHASDDNVVGNEWSKRSRRGPAQWSSRDYKNAFNPNQFRTAQAGPVPHTLIATGFNAFGPNGESQRRIKVPVTESSDAGFTSRPRPRLVTLSVRTRCSPRSSTRAAIAGPRSREQFPHIPSYLKRDNVEELWKLTPPVFLSIED